jgi:hypothetical protein
MPAQARAAKIVIKDRAVRVASISHDGCAYLT